MPSTVLTGLVGQFEVLIADIAHHFYRRAPGALGGDEKVISAKELLSFATLEEAKDHVVSDRVDDLLRGSLEDWRKFFESRLKVDLRALSPDYSRFGEYVQRRHLIVHAGSRISRRYLALVDDSLLKEYFGQAQLGMPVHLSRAYVSAALQAFEATGLALGLACWVKLHRDHASDQAQLESELVYDALKGGRWTAALHLASWAQSQETFDAQTRLIAQFNAWQSLKRLNRFAECEQEVRTLDASALNPQFSAVRFALLGDADAFFRTVERFNGAGLDAESWGDWPILVEMRQDPRFEEYARRYGKAPDPSADTMDRSAGAK